MNQQSQTAVIVGRTDSPDFRTLLPGDQSHELFRMVDDIDDYAALLREHELTPRLTVVTVSRPGQLTPEELQTLRRLAPMTPLVAVVGSWFEGDRRAMARDLGVPLFYWHQWPALVESLSARANQHSLPRWALPPTFAVDEAIQFNQIRTTATASTNQDERPLVAVYGEEQDAVASLVDMLVDGGYCVVGQASPTDGSISGARIVVCDLTSQAPTQGELVEHALETHPGAAVVVNVSFPRWQDVVHFRQRGIKAVFAKPFTNDDFLGQLGSLLAKPRTGASNSAA